MRCPSTEIIDQYVRFKLSSDKQDSFEDHIFECEDCYKEVQKRMDAWDDIMDE